MEKKKNILDLICIGEATIDIFCNRLNDMPCNGQWVVVDDITFYNGGCPTNTAIVASKLDLKTGLICNIGNDRWGDFLLDELTRQRVYIENVKRIEGYGTGKTVVLNVRDKDRTMIHDNGANATLDIKCIDIDDLYRARAVLLSSYISALPKLSKSDVIKIFSKLRKKKILTFLDVLIDPYVKNPIDYLEGLLDFTDYFLINEDEGRLITGCTDFEEQAKILLEKKANNVVIKLGKKGAYFCNGYTGLLEDPYEVVVKDSTGSGDAFNAGIIYGCLQGWGTKKTLSFSNIVGASAVTEIGCTTGIYSLEKIKSIMESRL
jgi:sugar/nucleoside kinase (ribokinase family)